MVHAKGNAGENMQKKKNMNKIIVLRSFCLNLGKENGKFFNGKDFFFFPQRMEILQEMGVFLWVSKQNICIDFKICMFQRVQHSQNILLREGRHVLLFSTRFM